MNSILKSFPLFTCVCPRWTWERLLEGSCKFLHLLLFTDLDVNVRSSLLSRVVHFFCSQSPCCTRESGKCDNQQSDLCALPWCRMGWSVWSRSGLAGANDFIESVSNRLCWRSVLTTELLTQRPWWQQPFQKAVFILVHLSCAELA